VVSYLEGLIASESSRMSRMVVNSSERCSKVIPGKILLFLFTYPNAIKLLALKGITDVAIFSSFYGNSMQYSFYEIFDLRFFIKYLYLVLGPRVKAFLHMPSYLHRYWIMKSHILVVRGVNVNTDHKSDPTTFE
jgi:hypothetical protein